MENTVRNVSCFTLGEEINSEDASVRLKITAIHIESNTLEARIIKANGPFAESRGREGGSPQDGFCVGMELIFKPPFPGSWTSYEKSGFFPNIPWFTLIILQNGQKQFVHYY